MESPRFRALLHATSGLQKHSIDSKGNTRHTPNRKLRGVSSPKENMMVMPSKFKRLKEEIDSELDVFTSDLVEILENTVVEHPEWQVHLANLLVISQTCSEMSLDEFWSKCEEIVQSLDDHRQELPTGTLKQVHTRILFILTRCTRLVQFQKEGGSVEQEPALGLHQFSDLGFYSESPYENLKTSMSAKDMKERIMRKRFQDNKHLVHDFSSPDAPSNASKISSWKKFYLSIETNQKKVSDEKVNAPSEKISDSQHPACKTRFDDNEGLDALKLSSKILESPIKQFPKVEEASGDYFTNPNIPAYEKLKMICRICDYEIPTMYAEGHFRVCSIADRCDSNGLTIEDRLDKVAEVLQKILESYMQRVHWNQGIDHRDIKVGTCSPEGSNHSSKYQNNSSDVPSSDTLDREIVGYLITNNLNDLPAILSNSHSALSSESMTPESPLMTPRGSQIDLLLSGTKEFANLENFQQIESLLDIVRSIAKTKTCHYSSLEDLSSFLEDLNAVVDTRKVDALVVETFGRRIAKLLQEKFIHLCGQIEDGNKEVASILVNEDGSLRNGLTCIARTSPLGAKIKDRTSIEDFEIIKPISRGAFGRVFLAKKRVTGDIFAIKVLRKADMIRKNAVKSILAERNILISARNPFVVRFYYSFTCKENLYLVMEYLNGGDLYSLLRSLGCMDEDMARIYVAEVVLALEYLHSMNVIHRDLKPDNLLIARDGHIKLTDFGLSKVGLISSTDDLSGPDVSGSVLLSDDEPMPAEQRTIKREQRQKQSAVGTPDYLAPEILLGMQHGPSADWWSVGVILFELLLGIPPFNAEHPQKIFDNIMNREIPWPRVPEEMSFEAYDLIEKLLITNPAQRLGATGAGEVKCHPFFKSINWDMLAMQKAAFIPSTEGEDDTSYFECRHSWNAEDEQLHASPHEYDYLTDTCSTSYSSSPHSSDPDEQGDECGAMAEFSPNLTINYSFSNFSFKNLSQLASINYDLIMKSSKDSA